MSNATVLLQSHHVIEQSAFAQDKLLKELVKHKLIDPNSSANRLYLPFDDSLAVDLEASPHRGRTVSSYTRSVSFVLKEIAATSDGVEALRSAPLEDRLPALGRVAERVSEFQSVLKLAVVNGDAMPTVPGTLETPEVVRRNQFSIGGFEAYARVNAAELAALRSISGVESEWAAVTRSEQQVVKLVNTVRDDVRYPVSAAGDVPEREVAGRMELRLAISRATQSGRLVLSEPAASLVEQVLKEDLPEIGRAKAGIYDFVANPPEDYKPLSQRRAPVPRASQQGFLAPEVFFGDLHAGKAAGLAGLALVAQEFAVAGHKWVELKFQGNDAGADTTAARFIGPNVGGALGGFVAGVSIGAATGSPTGPFALISAAGGGMLGAYLGDKWADQKAIEQVFNQEDQLKRVWSRDPASPDGRWFRGAHQQQLQGQDLGTGVEVRPLQTNLGDDVTFHSRYVATGTMERYLNWKAAQASYELGLSKRPETVDPYRLSAKDEVEPRRSQFETDRAFVRDSISREWEMHITEREDARVSTTHRVDVSPERAELLDAQSRLVIAENAANTPAAVAARYMVAYEQGRWSDFGDKDNPSIPAAVQSARESADTLVASDGSKYTRTGEGIWVHQGLGSTRNAAGNVLDELELTWQGQSEGVAGLAAMASEVRASLQVAPEGVRGLVEALYRKHGIDRSEEMLAATSAVLTHKLEVAGSSTDVVLELIPDPRTHAPSADSAIAAFIDGGGNRMVLKGTATADDVSEYIAQLRTEPSELPVRDAAQLQIDRLSVQERDAHEQAQREANRQGLSADQAGQVAMMAAAQVGSLESGQVSDALDVVPSFSHTGSGSTGGGDVAAAEAGRMAEAARVAAMSATEAAIPVEPDSARLNNDAPQVPSATHPEAEAPHHQTQQREQEAARAEQDRALQEQAATPAIEPQAPEAQVRQQPTDHRASVQPAHSPDNTATETHVTAAHLQEGAQASSTEAQHVAPLNPEGDPSAHKVDAPSEPVTPHAEELAEQEGAQVPDYQDALLASQLPVYEAHPEEALLLKEQAESAEVPVHAVPEPEPPHADEPARNRLEPSDPAHPANALYRQVREQVEKLDQSLGRTYDDTSERLTGSLMVLAKEGGVQRVDHVVLSNQVGDQRPGFNVFVVQGELNNPAHRRAVMPTEQAVTTPHEESLERLDVLLERDAQQQMQANMQREQDRERINEEHGRAMMMSGGG